MQNAPFRGRRGLSALSVALSLILLRGAMPEPLAAEQKVVEALYQSAKKEGQITIYSPNERVLQGLEKEFPKAFPGIEVKWTQAEPTDLATKLITEKRSGQVKADLAFGSLRDVTDLLERGMISTQDYVSFFRRYWLHHIRGSGRCWTIRQHYHFC